MADVRDPRLFWTDDTGKRWPVPEIRGRLKFRIPSHLALREFVIRRDGGACRECGSRERLVADHVVSRRNGGAHHPANMQCLCWSCNSRKVGLVDTKGVRA
ncbi:MAG: HNH endonuclease signature motif containing protein [Pseudomonadota bacterium]|nr:HNH endonuclease signature motif containing protein [Pseudomonadota bacterium]